MPGILSEVLKSPYCLPLANLSLTITLGQYNSCASSKISEYFLFGNPISYQITYGSKVFTKCYILFIVFSIYDKCCSSVQGSEFK